MLAVYRRLYDPGPGSTWSGSPPGQALRPGADAFVHDLGLVEAVSVTGSVSAEELEAYYRAADVFVCASDHEGFCVPLVEAMGHGVPVVAYGVAAVPETVGDAGLVLPDKEPLRFAAAVARVIDDGTLRRRLADAAATPGGQLLGGAVGERVSSSSSAKPPAPDRTGVRLDRGRGAVDPRGPG